MKKKRLTLFLILFLLSAFIAFSHEGEEEFNLDHSELYPVSQSMALVNGSVIFGILILHKPLIFKGKNNF